MDFLGGRLIPDDGAAIESHLSGCLGCRHALLAHATATAATLPGGVVPVPAPALRVGTAVGRYVIRSVLGQGGMGIVYGAFDPELAREVAIKLIRTERVPSSERAPMRAQLQREAQAMARLAHPNVLPVHDVGTTDDQLFVAMELCRGGTLHEWLKTPRTEREILRVMLAAGRGLAAAHSAGLVHRDFKPDNVLIAEDGQPKVSDFGLSLDVQKPGERSPFDGPAGTLTFMSPEQLRGEPADARSDQFSFCVTVWRALYGVRPFEGSTAQQLLAAIESRPPQRGARRVPARLRRALERGLLPSPAARFESLEPLLAVLGHEPVRPALLGAGVLAAAALLSTAALWWRAERRMSACAPPPAVLAEMWSPERRAAVAHSLGASSRVLGELDERVAAWSAMWTDACRATRVRGEQSSELLDLRVACLDDRRFEVAALTTLLSEGDAASVAHANAAVAALTSLEGCADRRALLSRARPPADREQAARVNALRRTAAQAKSEIVSGHTALAARHVDEILAADASLHYGPLEAQALYYRGALEQEKGDFAAAARTLEQSAVEALASGDDEVAAWAWNMMAFIDGPRLRKFDEARRWIDFAGAAIRRLGDRPDMECRRLSKLGQLQLAMGSMKEAVPTFEAVLECTRRQSDETPENRAQDEGNLANALAATGQVGRALELHGRSWRAFEKIYGVDHPDALRGAINYGYDLTLVGRHAEAEKILTATVAGLDRVLGPNHPTTANARINLGHALVGLHRWEEAIAVSQAAIATWSRIGAAHPALIEPLTIVAESELARGHADVARAALKRAFAIGDAAHVPESAVADARALERRLAR